MSRLYSETIFEMYLDFLNNYLSVEKFAEHNLLSVDHAKQVIDIGRQIAYDGLKQYQKKISFDTVNPYMPLFAI